MTRAARDYGIPLNILYSVGLTETGHQGTLNPYDMNVDGRAVHSDTLQRRSRVSIWSARMGRSSSTSAACRSTIIITRRISVR